MLCDSLKVWDGVGDRRGLQEGGTHIDLGLIDVDVWQRQHNIVKQLSSSKKKKKCVCWVLERSLFKTVFYFLNWRIIAFPCCVCFCCPTT